MLRIEQSVQELEKISEFSEFFIEYPKNGKRYPIVHYRDPKRRIYRDNGRISVNSLNKLLKNPLPTIRDYSQCNLIAHLGINEGIRDKLCSREKEEKLTVVLLKDFILSYWDYDNSTYLKKERELRGKEKTRDYCVKHVRAFNKHCLPLLRENLRLDEFTLPLMEKIQISMKEQGKANRTINETTEALKIPLKEAFKEGLIKDNIGDKIQYLRKSVTKERGILTEDEAKKLLTYLKESTTPKTWGRWRYLFVAIGYYTGMREGEILALKAEDLDSVNNVIDVRHSYKSEEKRLKCPKNGKTRESFPIPSQLMDEILEHAALNEGGFIFPSQKSKDLPINGKSIVKTFRTMLKAIGISDKEREERGLVFHSLRHGVATMLMDKGVDKEMVMKGLGHLTPSMTEHYSDHKTEEGRKRFIEATSGVIEYI